MSSKVVWGKMSSNGVRTDAVYKDFLVADVATKFEGLAAFGLASRVPREHLYTKSIDTLERMRDGLEEYMKKRFAEGKFAEQTLLADVLTLDAYLSTIQADLAEQHMEIGIPVIITDNNLRTIEDVRKAEEYAESLRHSLPVIQTKVVDVENNKHRYLKRNSSNSARPYQNGKQVIQGK